MTLISLPNSHFQKHVPPLPTPMALGYANPEAEMLQDVSHRQLELLHPYSLKMLALRLDS